MSVGAAFALMRSRIRESGKWLTLLRMGQQRSTSSLSGFERPASAKRSMPISDRREFPPSRLPAAGITKQRSRTPIETASVNTPPRTNDCACDAPVRLMAWRHAPKIDQPIFLVRASSATRPRWELPLASSPGDQTAIEALPGAIARTPPPTPLFPGRPTR